MSLLRSELLGFHAKDDELTGVVLALRCDAGRVAVVVAGEEKLARARALSQVLAEEITDWIAGPNWDLVQREIGAMPADLGAEYRATPVLPGTREVRSYVRNRPPLTEWSLRLGDIVHNLRSALDHAVFDAAVRSGLPFEESGTQFPAQKKPNPAGLEKVTPHASSAFRAVVESMQPYNVGKGTGAEVFKIVAGLNNVDKHRRLQVVEMHSGAEIIPVGGIMGLGSEFFQAGGDVSEDGALLGVIRAHGSDTFSIHVTRQVVIRELDRNIDILEALSAMDEVISYALQRLAAAA